MKNIYLAPIGVLILGTIYLHSQDRVEVQSASPASLNLERGGSATVTLQGAGLYNITRVQLMFDEKIPAAGVSASLDGRPMGGSCSVTLRATWDAKEGSDFYLRLLAGGEYVYIPTTILKVAVVWPKPKITSFPGKAPVGSVISIQGTGLGDYNQPDRTKVVISCDFWYYLRPLYAELISVSPVEVKARVPNGAYYSPAAIVTPGGYAYAPGRFEPQYIQHFAPDVFQPFGTLGSILHFTESWFAIAHGDNNSAFNPSSAMLGLGFQQIFFTFPPYERRINLLVGSTTFRVRVNGSNRLNASESIRTTSFNVIVNGMSFVIYANFESYGTEFVGEYETQDIFSKKISWNHCLDLNIDNLKVSATMPITSDPAYYPNQIRFGEIKISIEFSANFSVLGSPPFTIDQTPIKDYLQAEIEREAYKTFNSDGFKGMFNSFMNTYLRNLYQGTRVHTIQVQAAGDGGLDWVGLTH